MTLEELKKKFRKVCTNRLHSTKPDGSMQWYRHPDLYKFSKEAYEKGEVFFYTEPEDPERPNGNQKLCEPKYEYVLDEGLTEEEFVSLFGPYEEGLKWQDIPNLIKKIYSTSFKDS